MLEFYHLRTVHCGTSNTKKCQILNQIRDTRIASEKSPATTYDTLNRRAIDFSTRER